MDSPKGRLIQGLLEGDPTSFMILGIVLVFAAGAGFVAYLKQQAE